MRCNLGKHYNRKQNFDLQCRVAWEERYNPKKKRLKLLTKNQNFDLQYV